MTDCDFRKQDCNFMQPFFSIVVPVHNTAPYLAECLDSLLAQTFAGWEAVCIDDGSSDGSGAILADYAARDGRIRVFSQPNSGVSAARNNALARVAGRWIGFMDSDDAIAPDLLDEIHSATVEFPGSDAVRFRFTCSQENLAGRSSKRVARDVSKSLDYGDLDAYLLQNFFRREAVSKLEFGRNLCRGEDRLFLAQAMLRIDSYVELDCAAYFYRQHDASAMHRRVDLKIWKSEIEFRVELLRLFSGACKELPPSVFSRWICWFFEGHHIRGMVRCERGERRELFRYWLSVSPEVRAVKQLSPRQKRLLAIGGAFDSFFWNALVFFYIPSLASKAFWQRQLHRIAVNKETLKKFHVLHRTVRTFRNAWRCAVDTWCKFTPDGSKPYELRGEYKFCDRRKHAKAMLVILAGYKQELWPVVFGRVEKFLPAGMDVCIVTSGLENEYLQRLAAEKGWSYLATRRNNVSLAINIAIDLHPDAGFVYKMDEDIFVCDGLFERLKEAYLASRPRFAIEPGFAAPLLPVNGYGYVRVLKRLGLVEEWEKQFDEVVSSECLYRDCAVRRNPEAAKFLWRLGLDSLNSRFAADGGISICPHRFSIGVILFSREIWEEMHYFPVPRKGHGLGGDEEYLCAWCALHARAIVVAENALAGHLSYGPQNAEMMKFFREHQELFALP